MTVYKNFLRLIWSRKNLILINSIIFLTLSFVFLKTSGNKLSMNFEETALDVLIIDKDKTELSKELVKTLASKHSVEILDKNMENLSESDLIAMLKRSISLNKIDAGIIINKNLEANMQKDSSCVISIKDDRKQFSLYLDMQINKFLMFANKTKQSGAFDFTKIEKALNTSVGVEKLQTKVSLGLNEWLYHFFNYLGWLIFSIVLQLVGWVIFEIKDPAITMRNKIAPIKMFNFVAENIMAQFTVVILFLVFFIFAGILMSGKTIGNSPILLYSINAFVYSLVVLSITFMLTEIFESQQVIGIIGTIMPMALAFISGVFIPASMISKPILTLARFFPTYYFVQGNAFILANENINGQNLGIVFAFALLYFAIGLFVAKKKQKQEGIEFRQS